MKELKRVVLALDVLGEGFQADDPLPERLHAALAGARWLVEQAGARLTVLAVIEVEDSPEVRASAREILAACTAGPLEGVPHELEVAVGIGHVEIIRHVVANDVDCVIVASRHPSLFDRAIVGSTAMRLLRKCPCAVWVTALERNPGPWAVLSAVGSAGLAPRILDVSADMVRERGGEWHVLHVVEYPKEGGMRLRHRPQEEIDAYRRGVRDECLSQLESMARDVTERTGVKPNLWLTDGRPAEQIADAIEQQRIDLVVLGTVGRSGLPGVIIGNVAEQLLRRVQCSILALKPEGFRAPDGL